MSSSRFLSHHCVHLTELVARSPTPLNNTGQCGSAIISEIARTASGRAIVMAVPQRRPNYFGPPSFSPDHSLTYWLCSVPQAGAGPDMLVHEAGTWCMTVIQGHMILTSKQIWQCLTQSNIPARPSIRCKEKKNGTAFTRQRSTVSILSRHSWREHLCQILCDCKKQDRQTRMQTE